MKSILNLLFFCVLFQFVTDSLLVGLNSYQVYSKDDLEQIKMRSILRGNYKDVASENAGAIISNGRAIGCDGSLDNRSPFRTSIYYIISGGYCYLGHPAYLIVDLVQTYELNTIKIWLYDRDTTPAFRKYDIQVFITGLDSNNDELLLDSTSVGSLITIKFSERLVRQIKIFNRNGSTIDQWLLILKIQAFYQF